MNAKRGFAIQFTMGPGFHLHSFFVYGSDFTGVLAAAAIKQDQAITYAKAKNASQMMARFRFQHDRSIATKFLCGVST